MKRIIFCQTALLFIFFLGGLTTARSQVCNGSLGDPVINVNFGSGPNPGNQLTAASTSYFFTSSTCPNDGSYTVVNSTSGCFDNSWHTVSQDHTPGDDNGYMMLVNASFEPGDFYIDTVRNLCGNTTYEFAAWVTNVLLQSACGSNGITPNLVFNIETTAGAVLGTYATGSIPSTSSPTWKQYGLFFTTPGNNSDVVIRITNTAPGGCGNDLALDDITFRPCGPNVIASVVNDNQTTVDMCIGAIEQVGMKANIGSGYVSPALQWQLSIDSGITWTDIAGATTLTYQFNRTAVGTYKYRLTVADGGNIGISSCRVASNLVNVSIHDFPVITVGSNSPVCEQTLINLVAGGGASYEWTGPAGFTANTATPSLLATPTTAGLYNVTGTDQFGCVNTTSVTVLTNPKPLATVSNGATFCEGNSINLQAGGGLTYLWFPATALSATNIANPVASPADSTVYGVIVSGANNCTDTATVTLNVLKKPIADAGPDKVLLKGQTITLDGSVKGSEISITWSPPAFLSDATVAQPSLKPISTTRYTLNVSSGAGCGSSSDEVLVKVYNDIYVPTAFSPNGDGLNDTWRIDGLAAVPDSKTVVYNRFGNIVFEATGNNVQWDGTYKGQPSAPGAYVYMIELKNGLPTRKGSVLILR